MLEQELNGAKKEYKNGQKESEFIKFYDSGPRMTVCGIAA